MVDFGAGTNHWIEDYFGLSQVTCLTNQRVGISLKKSKSVAQVGTAMQTDFFFCGLERQGNLCRAKQHKIYLKHKANIG